MRAAARPPLRAIAARVPVAMANADTPDHRNAPPPVVDYVNRVHAAHDPGLARAFSVPAGIPAIQVGPSEGKLLGLLMRLVRATKVVELGTLVGYSTIHMARALA